VSLHNRTGTRGEFKFLPRLEALEDRACPAAIAFQDGEELKVISDDQPDTVAIVATGGMVTTNVNGLVQTFFGVEKIEAKLNGGNDAVFFQSNGFGQGPAAPNAFVQAAVTQNQQFNTFLLQSNNFELLKDATRFGKEVEVNIDGGDGLNAVFVSINPALNFNQFDYETHDIQLVTAAPIVAATPTPGALGNNFLTPAGQMGTGQEIFGPFANLGFVAPSAVPNPAGFLFNPDEFD